MHFESASGLEARSAGSRLSAARLGPRGPVGVSDVEGVGEVGDLGRRRRRGGGGRIRVRCDAAGRRVARVRERARAVRPPRAEPQGSAQAFTSQRALRPAPAPGEVDEAALVAAYAADRVAVARLVQILRPRRGAWISTACDQGFWAGFAAPARAARALGGRAPCLGARQRRPDRLAHRALLPARHDPVVPAADGARADVGVEGLGVKAGGRGAGRRCAQARRTASS